MGNENEIRRELFDENNQYDKREFWKPKENSAIEGILTREQTQGEKPGEVIDKNVITDDGGFSYILPDHQNLDAKILQVAAGSRVSVLCDRIGETKQGGKFYHYRVVLIGK